MAGLYPDEVPEDLEELAKQLPEDFDMEEFMKTFSEMAGQFLKDQGQKPFETQLLIFFGFLMIPLSLLLFCFCKILNSHKKRSQGKEKKKKEQKKETKKKA